MAEKQAVQEAPAAATEVAEQSAFATLLQREFRPQTDQVAQRIEGAVQILARADQCHVQRIAQQAAARLGSRRHRLHCGEVLVVTPEAREHQVGKREVDGDGDRQPPPEPHDAARGRKWGPTPPGPSPGACR